MANSKLLKESIADARAVKETAIANAKIALEEAFTPRLESMLSEKIESELEDDEDEDEIKEEYGADDVEGKDSSDIGAGEGSTESGTDNKEPSGITTTDHTELGDTDKETSSVGEEDDNLDVVKESEEDEEEMDYEDEEEIDEEEEEMDYEDEDDLDLDEIIAELEREIEDGEVEDVEDDEDEEEVEVEMEGADDTEPFSDADNPLEMNEKDDEDFDFEDEDEEEIDLDEILREMGYEDEEEEEEVDTADADEMEAELEEAYSTIRELQSTINEVNLLNAKLLYTNKLFRNYSLTNEQKMKVVETLDRTANVREVKLVFSTLAESFNHNGGTIKKKTRNKITESFASKPSRSTAPKKEIISEGNELAERFKVLANIK